MSVQNIYFIINHALREMKEQIMTKIYEDPAYFDDTAMRRISNASVNEDVKLSDTIETLMESDRKFRRKLIALREQQ